MTKFPGLDGQLRVLVDWILDVFLPRDITQLRLFHTESVAREHFEPGDIVFNKGDFGDKVYFIVQGEAAVVIDTGIIATLRGGEMFGEAALVSDHPRNASVHAVTALDAVAVNREAFHELFGNLPGLRGYVEQIMSVRMKHGFDCKTGLGKWCPPSADPV